MFCNIYVTPCIQVCGNKYIYISFVLNINKSAPLPIKDSLKYRIADECSNVYV